LEIKALAIARRCYNSANPAFAGWRRSAKADITSLSLRFPTAEAYLSRSNCSRLPWKQVHRHAHSLPQVWVTLREGRGAFWRKCCYPNREQLRAELVLTQAGVVCYTANARISFEPYIFITITRVLQDRATLTRTRITPCQSKYRLRPVTLLVVRAITSSVSGKKEVVPCRRRQS
jgi:hypothetical protein